MKRVLLILIAALSLASHAIAAKPPNIVLIISDDQSWTDYSFMGHEAIETPNIDRLAKQSRLFKRGYVPSSLCCPSLASMITGLYPHQTKITGNEPPMPPEGRNSEQYRKQVQECVSFIDDLPTLPRLLAKRGYVSHQSGKWWQGHYSRGGFSHGMTHGDPKRGGRHGDVGLKIGREGMDEIFDFIEDAGDKPFFVWYAPFLPHTPHNPPAEYLDLYVAPDRPANVAKYFAMCTWFDQTCGELFDALESRGILGDTLIVYVCDNGWAPVDRQAELPEGWWNDYAPRSKGSPFEGGIRTPIMLSWPGQITPSRSPDLAASIDLMPTIVEACGLTPPGGLPGLNLLDATACSAREAVFGAAYSIHNMIPGDPGATLQYRWCVTREWKLLLRSHGLDTTRYRTVHGWDRVPERLWNLKDDPAGTEDVLSKHPDVATRLRGAVDSWLPAPGPGHAPESGKADENGDDVPGQAS